MFGGPGEGSVYRRGEGVYEVRVSRGVEPQKAPAEPAEVPLRLARRDLIRPATVVELRVVDREVLLTLDLQGVRVGAEVDGVAAAPRAIASPRSCAAKTRTSRSAKSTTPTAGSCSAAPASSRASTTFSNLIIMTRVGVPVYLKDIAERHRTRPRIGARSRASTAAPASACASPSSPARTRCRSPRACAPRSSGSTAKCRRSASRCSTISRSSSSGRSTASRSTRRSAASSSC